MDMTTLARVKVYLESKGQKIKLDSPVDALLSALITEYSASFERWMDRQVLTASTTEYFTPEPGQRIFALKGWPVTSITSVYHDTERGWTTGEVDSDNYYIETVTGLLTIDGHGLFPVPGSLRVIYVGGMALNVTAFIAAYPEIAAACDKQVVYHYGRSASMGSTSISGGGGSVTREGALDLLPTVKSALKGNRRVVLG